MIENYNLDFNHFIFEKGEKDEEFYYLNQFFKISEIPVDEFLIYLEEYIYDNSSSLTVIDFIKYLKNNEEEIATKYVNLFTRYKTHKDTLKRIKEIIQEEYEKEVRKNKKITKYTRQFNRGNKKAALLLLKTKRKDVTDSEKSEIYYKAMDRYDFYTIKRLILDEGFNYIIKYPKLLKMVVEASEKTNNPYADYIAAKVYENKEYCSSINVTYSLEKAYAKYKKIENIKDEESIKKEVWARLGEMKEKGIGTLENKLLAIHYYEPYYPLKVERLKKELEEEKKKEEKKKETPKVEKIIKEETKVKEEVKKPTKVYKPYYEEDDYEYIGQRLNNALELIKEYPCKEFEDLLTSNRYLRQNIIQAFMMKPDETIIKEFKRRDHLLSIGMKLDEIYSKDGTFNETLIAIKTAPKVVKEVPIITPKKEVKEAPKVEKVAEKPIVNTVSTQVKTPSSIVSSNNTQASKPEVQFKVDKTPISDDNPYFKELYPEHKGWTFYDEAKAVARLRQRLNYPLTPHMLPEYDSFGFHRSKREREKQYIKDLETHKDKIRDYKDRLYSEENPLKSNYNEYREKVWGISPAPNVLVGSKFAEKCEKIYNSQDSESNKISIEAKSYVYCDREHKSLNNYEYVERMLSFVPNYAKEITLVIRAKVTYEKDYSSSYLDAYDAFENSEYSKMMTWQEFSDSSKSEIGAQIYINNLNDSYKNSNRRIQAENKRKEEITSFINKMFEEHVVFAGYTFIFEDNKKQYIEGKVLKIKFDFKFYE